MLPSQLANNLHRGLDEFLVTGFETPTPYFEGIVQRFASASGSFVRGPYISLGLPYRLGTSGRGFFPEFQTEHPPWLHQEKAWQRLRADNQPASTLIATGTGSGKTECFLYPILQHCVNVSGAGIKALLVYPMNALGTDQARRMAKLVHTTPAFNGLRIGLYTGDAGGAEPQTVMTPTNVITDRYELRDNPPDILLTNYKMLDFLLLRAEDQQLWRHNAPDTLRYLVVDELHTFDGAQGTDLACLLRRLKGRLDIPDGQLTCVGTSATLGAEQTAPELLEYAQTIFGEPFDDHSLIREQNLTPAEFLSGHSITAWRAEGAPPYPGRDLNAWLTAIHQWFFPASPPLDMDETDAPVQLAQQLPGHPLFQAVLGECAGQPVPIDDLTRSLAGWLPADTAPDAAATLVDGLLALVAIARDGHGMPLVRLRCQLWLRELRRMVADVTPDEPQLRFADDLSQADHSLYLPLGHCTQCHTLSWIGQEPPNERRITADLRDIYAKFFKAHQDTRFLLPLTGKEKPPDTPGIEVGLCGACGQLQAADHTACEACGEQQIVRALKVDNGKQYQHNGQTRTRYEHNCPVCHAQNSVIIFGARSATLASTALEHLWSNPANDDRKLVAFSDSVQDAAHRAGFFSARTWRNNIRMAIAQCLAAQDGDATLDTVTQKLTDYWHETRGFDDKRFIAEFIAPNMRWFSSYHTLTETGDLSDPSPLLQDVTRRLAWEAMAEVGYAGMRGRSLPRTGTVAAGINLPPVQQATTALLPRLVEHYGLHALDEQRVQWFLFGLALHLLRRGAIYHGKLTRYVRNGGSAYFFSREYELPDIAPNAPKPTFITSAPRDREFEPMAGRGNSWCAKWLKKVLDPQTLMPQGFEQDILNAAFDALESAGVVTAETVKGDVVWGLKPEQVILSTRVRQLATDDERAILLLPEWMAEVMQGAPALDPWLQATYRQTPLRRDWLRDYYLDGDIHRVIAAEHTALLEAEERGQIEDRFIAEATKRRPWYPNLLSATPTLEMGIDIGGLSTVMLCSVPPSQANYLQRIGRAGRRDGNSLSLALASAAPHDLYFYQEPMAMMAGAVTPPGLFLNAAAVIRRQLFGWCLDRWVISDGADEPKALPFKMREVLDSLDPVRPERFPHNLERYLRENGETLLDDFLALFDNDLREETRQSLRDFLFAGDQEDGLLDRLYKRLWDTRQERDQNNARVEVLRRQIRKLEREPDDEATRERIKETKRERDEFNRLVSATNGKQTLEFLANEGLLPNYAFPDTGVTLRSVIYFGNDDEGNPKREAYDYERPASAALAELAPENQFYVDSRKLKIRQVYLDSQESAIESWRFCPDCTYMARTATDQATDTACPRCGSGDFADIGQQRELLRLRTVMAYETDRKSRIGDDRDDREPSFYQRQMFVDFNRDAIGKAWRIEKDDLPFGFEFLRRAEFREINFGEQGLTGNPFTIAGQEAVRPGFTICRHCGRVQSRRPNAKSEHAVTCTVGNEATPEDYTDCLYLYREFESEAVRILMPPTVLEADNTTLNSFIAGLQLGLREHYRGEVTHLRATTYDEPIAGSESRKQYLVLYDTVPGGTGYLRDLLSNHEKLIGVLASARDIMAACPCQHDYPERDGCYQCLYAYRNSYGMDTTSRRRALDLFSRIVDSADEFVDVATVDDIEINPVFDSKLEALFVPALRQANEHGFDVQCQTQIINGKPGFYLRVGRAEYTIEPQVHLGPEHNVSVACQPDFVIRPARSNSPLRPIAVFMDGYEYHRDTLADDTRKRLSLVRSGQYLQWSLIWQDVLWSHNDTTRRLFREHESSVHPQLASGINQAFDIQDPQEIIGQRPLAQLLTLLSTADESLFQRHCAARLFHWLIDANAPNRSEANYTTFEQQFETCAVSPLLDHFRDQGPSQAVGGLAWQAARTDDPIRIFCAAPLDVLNSGVPYSFTANLVFDDRQSHPDEIHRSAWAGFVHAMNLFQFMPVAGFTTLSALPRGFYDDIDWRVHTKEETSSATATDAELEAVIGEAAEELAADLRELVQRHLPLPIVGYELANADDEVVAEAELAWPDKQVVLLLADQQDQASTFEAADWTVLMYSESWLDDLADLFEGDVDHG